MLQRRRCPRETLKRKGPDGYRRGPLLLRVDCRQRTRIPSGPTATPRVSIVFIRRGNALIMNALVDEGPACVNNLGPRMGEWFRTGSWLQGQRVQTNCLRGCQQRVAGFVQATDLTVKSCLGRPPLVTAPSRALVDTAAIMK